MFNYVTLNKKNFKNFINNSYDIILDDFIRAKHLNDFKLECFCNGYIDCLNDFCIWYNVKLDDKIIDKRNKLDYI